ncbi:MAG: beta strand repeat-containing protein, partial [Sediminibacterium sp.]
MDCFAQVTYYSKASGNANSVSTWGTNTDGSGPSPADFISGDIFIVRNGSSLTTSGAWNIDDGGIINGGVLRIATGGLLTASNAITFSGTSTTGTTFSIQNGGTYQHALSTNISTSILTATTLDFQTGSNFEIRATGSHTNAVGAVFYNLIINNSATVTITNTIVYVGGVLTINSGSTLRFSNTGITSGLQDATGSMTTSGTGLLRIASTSTTNLPSSITWNFQVNYDGAGIQRIQPGTYSTLNATGGNRVISSGSIVTISGTFTPGLGTYTLTGSTIEYSGNGSANIPNLPYNNLTISGTGTKSLTTDLTVNGILSITNASGFLAINGNTLTLNGTTDLSNGKLIGSSTSKLIIGGSTVSTSNINFSQSGTDNQLQSLTLNRTGGGGATLLSEVDIINTLTLTNGI